jgi:hypothetical protein
LSFGTKNHRRAVISISSVSLRPVSMSTPSIQMGEGRPLNFFPSETLKFRRTHSCGALECLSPAGAHNFLSRPHLHVERARNLVCWEIASGAAIAGSNYCDKSAVWSHQPASHRGDRFSAEKLNMLVRAISNFAHTLRFRSNWCCASERSNFSAQASGHCVRRAGESSDTAALGSRASNSYRRVLRYGSATQESRFGSHSSFGSPRQQRAPLLPALAI